jgi:CHAD domain-containing protein
MKKPSRYVLHLALPFPQEGFPPSEPYRLVRETETRLAIVLADGTEVCTATEEQGQRTVFTAMPGRRKETYRFVCSETVARSACNPLASCLLGQAKALRRHARRIQKDCSPDSIHSFRTAARKAETICTTVLETEPSIDRCRKDLKGLGKETGKIRDLDVLLSERTTLGEPLARRLEKRRRKRCRTLRSTLRGKQATHTAADLERQAIRCMEDGFLPDKDVLAKIRIELTHRGLEACSAPTDRHLHQVRIGARKICHLAPLFPEAASLAKLLEQLLDTLGRAHDLHVRETCVKRHIEKGRTAGDRDFLRLERLLRADTAKEKALHEAFCKQWVTVCESIPGQGGA